MNRTDTLALNYHEWPRPGKIEVVPSKPCESQDDLSLAYTPGVAAPCLAIAKCPEDVYRFTGRGNLVAVISNGTAVLGLGDLGPLAAKPVMEGKAALFKTLADIDVFDIELAVTDPDELVGVVKALEPTFGGINLEDIAAPDCFYIEETLQTELQIPVFHDDQHGTAIIVGAALLNGLEVVGKAIADVRIVVLGAGAAGIACAEMCLTLGASHDQITLLDSTGVVYRDRSHGVNAYKLPFARDTAARSIADALVGADVFIGVSAPNQVTVEMLRSMAPSPIVFALSNPDPEIAYDIATATRSDVVLATGRSDYPNQVNNVLGFPSIFRGALDVRARVINDAMKLAAVRALASLAREPVPKVGAIRAGAKLPAFGPSYLIPNALDRRVVPWVAPAVATAAIESGVAGVAGFSATDYADALTRRLAAGPRSLSRSRGREGDVSSRDTSCDISNVWLC
jgi:malate dehydrogenase (oxaloacetate-decarboxylating)(NADP+)